MEEVPFDDRHVPRVEIDWERSAWWWHPLTRAVHPAVRMNSLALSLVAICLIQAGILLANWLFEPARQRLATPAPDNGWMFFPLLQWAGSAAESILSYERVGVRELAFITLSGLWLTLCAALLGGVLARRSLVELGQRTLATWGESVWIVFSRWQSFLWWLGMHWIGVLLLLIPFAGFGLLSRFGALGATVAGVLLLLFFPMIFAVGRFAISLIVCFPLSVCAIVAEKKADAFEGFSRSNAYVFQRPVVAALCGALLLVIGLVGEQLVYWTITFGWYFVRGAYLYAGGAVQPSSDAFVSAGNWLSRSLILAYWFSYFWSAAAAVYLILRKSVDNTELDEMEMLESPVEQSLPDIPASPELAEPQMS